MQKRNIFIILLAITLIFTIPSQAMKVNTGGMVDSYLEVNNDGIQNKYNSLTELNIKLDTGTFDYTVYLDGSILLNQSNIKSLNQFSLDTEFKLNKLYFNYWYPQGKLKIGKQRIAWGSGYFFNPTDIINPLKETQKGEMNPRQATNSIYWNYYLGKGRLEGILVTEFQTLGPEINSEATALVKGINSNLIGEVNLPKEFNEEKEFALRYSTLFYNYDLAIQYYKGREDYPVQKINYEDKKVIIDYPKKDVIGVNAAGTLGNVGIWGEATYSRPKIGGDYLQAIVGTDYTFENGIHLLGEYFLDDSFSNFFPGTEIDVEEFIGVSTDYSLTDFIKVRGSYMKPLNSDVYLINGEVSYSINQNTEFKAVLNRLENESNTIFAEGNSMFPSDKISLKMTYYY